jgi:long-chain acyl-CoA synthetase
MTSHLYEIVRRRSQQFPGEVAVGGQIGLQWQTYDSAGLLAAADAAAAELAALGVRHGDRVVLWVPNHLWAPAFLFGLWRLGAIAVPFDREMNPEAGARILALVEPRLTLVGYGETPPWANQHPVTEWWQPGSRGAPALSGDWSLPDEPLALISFTSGTTGAPKGCMITHANVCAQVDVLEDAVPLAPGCRLASVLPLSHLLELTVGMLYPISKGAAVHYVPSRRGPDIVRVLKEQRITHMIGVPQLLTLMGQALEDRLKQRLPGPLYQWAKALAARLPIKLRRLIYFPVHRVIGGQLRMMASGGAALPEATYHIWERLGVRVLEGYGTSECSPVVACCRAAEDTPPGSVGRALRNVELRLSAEGEMLVRGPNVMAGYWLDPERTAEVLKDGWYYTGDLASIDERGRVRILGRVKDLIVLPSGMKVWPQDVEEELRREPGIKDAAVVSVPTAAHGATLHAYLLPLGAERAPIERVVAQANGRLAVHQRITSASWWPDDDFPRTTTLKVKRNLLPKPGQDVAVQVDALMASDDPVLQAVQAAARTTSVSPNQTLAELGLDSLGLVELAIALEEKTGRTISEDSINVAMTVADLKQALMTAAEGGPAPGGSRETWTAEPPLWPYTWGRAFRKLALPIDLLYSRIVTRTLVLGGEKLEQLPPRIIFAGTHHGFADMPLLRHGLRQTAARRYANGLVIATTAAGWVKEPAWAWFGILAFGLYPLRQHQQRDVNLRRLLKAADAGNAVLVFPQGVHARPEEEISGHPHAQFHTGVTHLARALDAAVVPFGVAGTEKVLPAYLEGYKGLVIAGIPMSFTPGPLVIAFGAAMVPERDEGVEAFTDRLQDECFRLTRGAEAAWEAERRGAGAVQPS